MTQADIHGADLLGLAGPSRPSSVSILAPAAQTPIILNHRAVSLHSGTELCFPQLHQLQPEIIIVGAGIAGASLAYSLSHTGRRVLLIERDLSEPDRIVGELLQPGGVAALTQLGLDAVLEGIDAVPVEGYCVVSGERRVGVPYPALEAMVGESGARIVRRKSGHIENGETITHGDLDRLQVEPGQKKERDRWHVESVSGKKEGRSFHHGRLIAALRKRCIEDAPNLTVIEGAVRDLVYCEHTDRIIGVSAAVKFPTNTSKNIDVTSRCTTAASLPESVSSSSEQVTLVRKFYAPITIIADGCYSKFRTTRGSRLPTPLTRSHFVGVILKDVTLPMERHGTVCLTPAGPVLLYQIADQAKETRMLVDVKGKLPNSADGSLQVSQPNSITAERLIKSRNISPRNMSRIFPRPFSLQSAMLSLVNVYGRCPILSFRHPCKDPLPHPYQE